MYTNNVTNTDSNMTENSSDLNMVFVETQDTATKVAFVLIACAFLSITSSAIAIMQRTKKTPYTTKLLSSGLMVFDSMFMLTSTIRKFITDPVMNLTLQLIIGVVLSLTVTTIGMMAVERYVLIIKPIFYMNNFSEKRVKILITAIWVSVTLLSICVMCGACFNRSQIMVMSSDPGNCVKIYSLYFAVWNILVLFISIFCYYRIHSYLRTIRVIDRTMKSQRHPGMQLQKLKNTSLVLAYIAGIMFTYVAYAIVVVLVNTTNVNYSSKRLIADISFSCGCLFHPVLYVLWFKESRLVMLRMLARFFTSIQPRVYSMTIEVYDIVLKTKQTHT